MSQPLQSTLQSFDTSAEERLAIYCSRRFPDARDITFSKLVGDASPRQYFRIARGFESEIAAVYPEAFDPQTQSYCDVTGLFAAAHVPVPQIIDVSGPEGVILQEDLGDNRLQDWLGSADKASIVRAYYEAIDFIILIQSATPLAYKRQSVASKLAFDEPRLFWELKFFYLHFCAVYEKRLTETEEINVMAELTEIARELAERPRLLTHRDYHSRNLMIGANGRLFVIDHQDARLGPYSYDLASLLYDPYAGLDQAVIEALYDHYVTRLRGALQRGELSQVTEITAGAGQSDFESKVLEVQEVDLTDFRREFQLMTLQRMLKAIGTYTYQKSAFGNDVYEVYIEPALAAAKAAMISLNRFPALQRLLADI